MPIPEKYLADFEESETYHVYNRTNNREPLFLSDDNRLYFLKRYKEIVSPFADTYCWNLLPNHFHLLIRIKPEKTIIDFLKNKPKAGLTATERNYLQKFDNLPRVDNLSKVVNPEPTFHDLISQTFKRFFQSYSLAFNKQNARKGNLFYRPFKRVKIESDAQFTMALIYVHANAAKHGLVKDFTTHVWSSWHSIISKQPTSLLRDAVIEWFGDVELCIKSHIELAADYYNCEIAIED